MVNIIDRQITRVITVSPLVLLIGEFTNPILGVFLLNLLCDDNSDRLVMTGLINVLKSGICNMIVSVRVIISSANLAVCNVSIFVMPF